MAGTRYMPATSRVLFDDRLHHRVLKVAVQLAVRIVRLDHHDPHDLFFGIHPEVRAIRAIPSEATRRHAVLGADWIGDYLHTQTVATARRSAWKGIGHKRRRNQLYGLRAKKPLSIPLSTGREHHSK